MTLRDESCDDRLRQDMEMTGHSLVERPRLRDSLCYLAVNREVAMAFHRLTVRSGKERARQNGHDWGQGELWERIISFIG